MHKEGTKRIILRPNNFVWKHKIKVKNFSWVDYGQINWVDWWETNIELIINKKTSNLNVIREEYLDDDGGGKGSLYRIKDNNGNILYDGLWVVLG